MIPEAAVEAAARAAYDAEHETTWEQLSDGYKASLKGFVRAALEAAAPHMLREARGEGWGAGTLSQFTEPNNPYRIRE